MMDNTNDIKDGQIHFLLHHRYNPGKSISGFNLLDPIENPLHGECYETFGFDKSAEYLDKYTPGTYITKVGGLVRPVLSSDEHVIGCITRGIEKDNHSEYGCETIVYAPLRNRDLL